MEVEIMKWILSLCVVIISFGCGSQHAVNEQPLEEAVDRKELWAAVESTLQDILVALHDMKSEFPQLAKIDSTPLRGDGFTYSKGLQSAFKAPEPKFDENGGYISVEIAVYDPADPAIMEEFAVSQRAWDHYEVNGAVRYAVWTLVAAEPTAQGNGFKERVETLIADHLEALQANVRSHPLAHAAGR
jgi:hypothetical protein